MKKLFFSGLALLLLSSLFGWSINGCGQTPTSSSGGTINSVSSSACTVTANTSASTTVNNGCTLLTRDCSGCLSSRTAQGLTGAWLKFSCNVGQKMVTISGTPYIQMTTHDEPDYDSNYFASTSACYAAYTTSFPDPNTIASQSVTENIPYVPNTTSESMSLGVVGIAVNGVVIYDNQAAPGDDIYNEVGSFDECQGHPDSSSMYHYHTEPYSISHDDANLIGVMRDGYLIYGRRDMNGTVPSNLDSYGGHTAVTADSNGVAVYHYHLNLQTSTNSGTAGQQAWFLTTGTYSGTIGP